MDERQPTWLTPAAHRRLTEELEELRTTGREHMAERIAEARSHGDIRENADYEAAKNEQGMMEARIRKIQALLDTAEVRDVTATEHVEVGCIVTTKDGDGGETEFFVAPPENKIPGFLLASPTSPLGEALLGAAVGDTVSYEAPGGTFALDVVGIRPFEG
jgi:transcription elongation factor GreA